MAVIGDDELAQWARTAGVPGGVVGVLDGDDVGVLPFGVVNADTGVETTPDSLFQIGSVTKLWTATMIQQLVDEGRLDLDLPLSEVLPEAPLAHARTIRVRHLLNHTSGIDGDVFRDEGPGDDCVQRYVAALDSVEQVFPPGSAYSYCNTGFVLLGRIIELLDGHTWDTSLQQRLAGPLGLAETTTLAAEAIRFRAALGHNAEGETVTPWQLPRSIGPAGLITQSAGDLLAFADAVIGDRVPGVAHVDAMLAPTVDVPGTPRGFVQVGRAWRRYRWGDRDVIGHDGHTMAQLAFLRIDRAARFAVCLLTNSVNAPALADRVLEQAFRRRLGVSPPPAPEPDPGLSAVDPQSIETICGHYERAGVAIDVRLDDGRLLMRAEATGDSADIDDDPVHQYALLPVATDGRSFVIRARDDQPWSSVVFADDATSLFSGGRVTPRR